MPDYTVYLFDSQIAASRVLRVGAAADRIAHMWTNATAHEDITVHLASATTPLRTLVQVLEELCWPAESAAILATSFPTITLEAQGVVASPQVDRALVAELIARSYVLGAHNHLYMAVGARGVIAAYGKRTYVEDVIEGSGEQLALMSACSMDRYDPQAPLAELCVSVRLVDPATGEPTDELVDVLQDAAEVELGLLPLGQAWHADQHWKLVGPCGICAVESNPRCRFCA